MDARILIVEEVTAVRRSLEQAVELAGHTALPAYGLADALDVAACNRPDVMVVDDRLIRAAPDAFALLTSDERLRGVLIVALCRDIERRRHLADRGVHCVVSKPFTDRELLAAVGWALDVYGPPDRPGRASAPASPQ